MCMGLGCNACGVTGCRIIDSPRERLIAMLTNSFAPCNGRFPLLVFLCTAFFAGNAAGGAPDIEKLRAAYREAVSKLNTGNTDNTDNKQARARAIALAEAELY